MWFWGLPSGGPFLFELSADLIPTGLGRFGKTLQLAGVLVTTRPSDRQYAGYTIEGTPAVLAEFGLLLCWTAPLQRLPTRS
jgi:hypothetical protein